MSDETTLLPCPFCGGEASRRLFYGARYGVYCDECDARVGGLFNTEAEAIAAWNARAEHGTLTAEHVREVIERHVKFYEGGDYDEQAIADELNAHVGRTCEACAFSKPTDLTDGCAALERIAELEEECDQLRKAVAYWQRMYEEQIGVRR